MTFQKELKFNLGNPKKTNYSIPRWKNPESNNSMYRSILREGFGNSVYLKTTGEKTFGLKPGISKTTPFRTAMNAGDINGTFQKAVSSIILPKPSNQVSIGNSSLKGIKNMAGSVRRVKNGSYYSGNPRFVYDGSVYTVFKKLQAINRNYNDPTFGGDQHHASQQAYSKCH